MLSATHRVGSGLAVRLRLTRPSDADKLVRFFERLSPESLQRRFFTAMPAISHATLRHFTFYNPSSRLVVAATVPIDGTEEIVGLADLSMTVVGLGEFGLVVDDDHQAMGIGRLLTEAIATLAASRGATHLKAETLDRNPAVQRLMEGLGPTSQTVEDGTSVLYARLPTVARRAA